jgi:hypothetical protein
MCECCALTPGQTRKLFGSEDFMDGILRWSDAVGYFGDDIEGHRGALCKATQSTYGLLACRIAEGDASSVVSGGGEHAERKLIRSSVWNEDLNATLSSWDPRRTPMLVLVMLNRSPCGDCAHLLASALHRFNDKYALTTENQHFVLAALGYYHSNTEKERKNGAPPQTYTTDRGLRALKEAGWKLCTLSFDIGLTRRGQELNNYLNRLD